MPATSLPATASVMASAAIFSPFLLGAAQVQHGRQRDAQGAQAGHHARAASRQ